MSQNTPSQTPIISGPLWDQASLCAPILRALPGWFGIESATQQYIEEIDHLPTFLAQAGVETIGFLSLKQHNPHAAEIYVMGVQPAWHRTGTGRALVEAAQDWLRAQNVDYLQVKTLADTHPDLLYARTRAFYESMGFKPLEVFPTLWDTDNPCLLLVKVL